MCRSIDERKGQIIFCMPIMPAILGEHTKYMRHTFALGKPNTLLHAQICILLLELALVRLPDRPRADMWARYHPPARSAMTLGLLLCPPSKFHHPIHACFSCVTPRYARSFHSASDLMALSREREGGLEQPPTRGRG
jgi:hypothetical protein